MPKTSRPIIFLWEKSVLPFYGGRRGEKCLFASDVVIPLWLPAGTAIKNHPWHARWSLEKCASLEATSQRQNFSSWMKENICGRFTLMPSSGCEDYVSEVGRDILKVKIIPILTRSPVQKSQLRSLRTFRRGRLSLLDFSILYASFCEMNYLFINRLHNV